MGYFPGFRRNSNVSVKLRIDDPDENGIGEIVAQGPNIMLGYYNQPERRQTSSETDGSIREISAG